MTENHPPSERGNKSLLPQIVPQWLLRIFPLLGFISGLLVWLLDAAIDAYIVHPDESFLFNVFSAEPRELWMRSLVVIVMMISAVIAQRLLLRQKKIEILLRDHQLHLEKLVAQRTSELEQIANLDPLTRIYNRRKFTEILEREIQRFAHYQKPLSLIMCDIDFFKKINDDYGHQVGDMVLKKLANVLRQNLRSIDSYARWGGEEFIILLPQTGLEEARLVAEKLRSDISHIEIIDSYKITASFGVSQYVDNEGVDPLIKRADDLLYQAKQAGRDRVLVQQ